MEFQLTRALEILERTPAIFRALLGGLPEAWTAPNEGPDTFSAFDNVGHLIQASARTGFHAPALPSPRARIAASSPTTGSRSTTRAGVRAWRSSLTSSRASAPRT
jgi:hypothetical protein